MVVGSQLHNYIQMALRRPVFAPSVLTAGSNCGSLWGEQCLQPSLYGTRIPRRRVHTPVERLHPFEWVRIVGLWEDVWTYRRIPAHVGHNVSVVCRFQQWSLEHSYIHRPGSGWPRITDARQDRRIVQAAVAARTASRKKNPGTFCTCYVINPYSVKGLGDRLYTTLHKMPGEVGCSFCLFLKS